jgi:hypothetical protein
MTMTTPATTPADGELLPCPFCQGTHVKPIEEDGRWAVYCFYCTISGPDEVFRSDAILSWNARRAQTTPPKHAAPSPGKAEAERCDVGHAHFTPFYLLANARRIVSREHARKPNWVLATELFAVGSTTANRLCREAGIDPDAFEVRRPAIQRERDKQ